MLKVLRIRAMLVTSLWTLGCYLLAGTNVEVASPRSPCVSDLQVYFLSLVLDISAHNDWLPLSLPSVVSQMAGPRPSPACSHHLAHLWSE